MVVEGPTDEKKVSYEPLQSDHYQAASGPVFRQGEEVPLAGMSKIMMGLSWDMVAKGHVDLDASCVCFDADGEFMSSVYFGALQNENRSIVHSGDNRTGEGEGDDEIITVDLHRVPKSVRVLVFCVTSYQGDSFFGVETAAVRLADVSSSSSCSSSSSNTPREIGSFSLAAGGSHSAMIMGFIHRRKDGLWYFQAIGRPAEGRSFGDLIPAMQTELRPLIPHIRVGSRPDVLVLTKGEIVSLTGRGSTRPLNSIMLGLGWDMMGRTGIDLDASCVMFDGSHACVDSVFFNKLRNGNGSVRHGGDNLTGEGEGDDEKIFVDLDRIPSNVVTLFFVVNSYGGVPFSNIKNAFVRLVDLEAKDKRKNELIRFQLAGTGDEKHTALIMCKLFALQSTATGTSSSSSSAPSSRVWKMKAIGHGDRGTLWRDIVPAMQQELAGRLLTSDQTAFQYARYQPEATSSLHPTTAKDAQVPWQYVLIILACIGIYLRFFA
jgi:stress response protein SCP2